jgi:hypothetical protein
MEFAEESLFEEQFALRPTAGRSARSLSTLRERICRCWCGS